MGVLVAERSATQAHLVFKPREEKNVDRVHLGLRAMERGMVVCRPQVRVVAKSASLAPNASSPGRERGVDRVQWDSPVMEWTAGTSTR